jgi:hypothetical protein
LQPDIASTYYIINQTVSNAHHIKKNHHKLSFMIVFLIKVSNEEAIKCDGEISMDELCKALLEMNKNKCLSRPKIQHALCVILYCVKQPLND